MGTAGRTNTIPDRPEYATLGTKLMDYNSDSRFAVVPEGIESIADDAFQSWRPPDGMRPRIYFPDSLRRLTWAQLDNLGDVTVTLPAAFLEADGGGTKEAASKPLRTGWFQENITLGGAARAYLLKDDGAALAMSIIGPDSAGRAAERMVDILRARMERGKKIPSSVLLRAVVFFILNVESISADTAYALVQLLPNGRGQAARRKVTPVEGNVSYHPALLEYVLRAVHIPPNHSAFRGLLFCDERTDTVRPAHPEEVHSAMVPYIALGLSAAIRDGASRWLPWARFQPIADAYLECLEGVSEAAGELMPILRGNALLDCVVMLGRFGAPEDMKRLTEKLEEFPPRSRRALQIQTGMVLGYAYPDMSHLDDAAADALLQRFVEAQIEAVRRGLMLRAYGFEGDEKRAKVVLEAGDEDWEVVVGPDFQVRWRPQGERYLSSGTLMHFMMLRILVDFETAPKARAASTVVTLEKYLPTFAGKLEMLLTEHYLNGVPVPAPIVRHMMRDLTMMQGARGIVWDQDGTQFTVSGSGAVDAAGMPVQVTDAPVQIAYAPEMDPEDVEAWRLYFQKKKYDSWKGHMEQPDYSLQDISEDRFRDTYVRKSELNKKKMLPVLRETRGELDSQTSAVDIEYSREKSGFRVHKVTVDDMYRMSNRILYQLDVATMKERVERDDETILPYLERAPRDVRKKALKAAEESGANNVRDAILHMMDSAGENRRRR